MQGKNKGSNKLNKPIPILAQIFADRFIAGYGIVDAEIVAKLCYEKIVAKRKALNRKYGRAIK